MGIETVWFGQNITAAFATGQARGAALVACAESNLDVGEFTPRQIKLAVVGTGSAEKEQVQYMVRKLLALDHEPRPDHASDALAAAICYTTHDGPGGAGGSGTGGLDALVAKAMARDEARTQAARSCVGGSRAEGEPVFGAQRGSAAREELLSNVRKG